MVREHSGRILASLIGRYRDFDLAEESLQDAWLVAAETWPVDGWPDNPPGWVFTVASRKALDTLRRERTRSERHESAHADAERRELDELDHREERWHSGIDDDRLRLIFTCCHPAIDPEAQVALTLRSVAWLTTDEIATAFGVPPATMAQRIVRAKHKIRSAGLPYRVPVGHELPDRLAAVLKVIYLVYNEAYLSNRAAGPIRFDLADEAIRLGRTVVELMPDEPEAVGLLALMLVQQGRTAARFDGRGDLVTLEHQDRDAWDHETIAEGSRLLDTAMRRRAVGQYQLHAAVAALHSEAPSWRDTDWRQIAALYDVMAQLDPGPVVALNKAVAVGFARGHEQGLAELDRLASANVPQPHLLHAARAEMLLRLGDDVGAAESFDRALELVRSDTERRHLERRRASLEV